jgi:putative ABC transport system permease protein
MWRVTLRGVLYHKVRYALTAIAVLLGVAFIAGTLVLTDTIGHTFDGLFADVYQHTAAVVRAKAPFVPSGQWASQRATINARLATEVRKVPGVTDVALGVEGYAQLVSKSGKPIGNPAQGAPTLGEAWTNGAQLSVAHLLPGGTAPTTSTEVAIDKHSADVGGFHVGDRVLVLTKDAPTWYTISGIVKWGQVDSPLGASLTFFDPTTASQVLAKPGQVDQIAVAAAPGISQDQMAARLRATLPSPRLEVVTGKQITQEGQSNVRKALSFFNTFLLAFAIIALFVGSFQIFNTFSIVINQRARELGLLRAIGTSQRQVMRGVLGESLAVGLFASLAGLGAGLGLALLLRMALGALGIDIPATGLVVTSRTVLVSLIVGCAVTVVAAFVPARRAARVPPLAAMREVAIEPRTTSARVVVAGAGFVAIGLLLLSGGLWTHIGNRLAEVGLGAACTFIGIATLGPLFVRTVVRLLGRPLQARGVTGTLARENAARNPRRSATAAGALMVGVAVVTLMSIISASLKATVNSVVDSAMKADFVITAGGAPGGQVGFSPALERRLSALPQVASITGVQGGLAKVGGTEVAAVAADPTHLNTLFDLGVTSGQLATMGPTDVAISQQVANNKHLTVGETLRIQFIRTGTVPFRVAAIYRARDFAGDYVLPLAAAQRNFTQHLDFQVYAKLKSGISLDAGRQLIKHAIAAYPTASILDRAQYKKQQAGSVDQLLALVNLLLSFALLLALLGIANTLSLSIYERTRELGLLRAVGMTRRQLRRSIREESLLITLFGTLEGIAVGVIFGCAIVSALGTSGISELAVPTRTLIELAIVSAIAGVIAAIAPSRRASKLDVLRAIATD